MDATPTARERWRAAYRQVRRMRHRSRREQSRSEMSRWACEILLRAGEGRRPAVFMLRDVVSNAPTAET